MRLRLAVLALAGSAAIGTAAVPPATQAHAPSTQFKAVAFDYFVLFNPDSVVQDAERAFPGKGKALTDLWRTRQFEYAWLRAITRRYADFMTITDDALVYSAQSLDLRLTPPVKERLLGAYLRLTPWPDTVGALRTLKASGIRVVTLANFTPAMLRANAGHAGLTGYFDAFLSTDVNRTYKPDPRAYRLAIDALHLEKHEIVFAAFGGWDAAGAKSFGYPTFWVNRFHQPREELGPPPDGASGALDGLLDFVLNRGAARPHG